MSTGNNEMDEALVVLQKNMAWMFGKNMAFFKENRPDLYNAFENYTPDKIGLRLHPDGYINAVNVDLNNSAVYSRDPMEFCAAYVDSFIKSPVGVRLNFRKTAMINEENDVHLSTSNNAIGVIADAVRNNNEKQSLPDKINYMILNGVGLGYIVSEFLERIEINNLVIIEPHKDLFYFAMHLLDWQQVAERFNEDGKSLQLLVGESPTMTFEKLRINLANIGPYNAGYSYIVDHLSSKEMKDVTEHFVKSLPGYMASLGFADDEIWSLAHTLENLKKSIPVMHLHSKVDSTAIDVPVFMIANGPSLDEYTDYLREQRENAVYISCGSAIGTLKRMGIKPDIHLEMERRKITPEWIAATTDEDYRKGITFIGLNTLHPDTFDLFEKSFMVFKPSDLGTHFASQFICKGDSVVSLPFCNPTVGNMGVAITGALGARDVYMFGLDMAFSDDGSHHSNKSDYYNTKPDSKKDDLFAIENAELRVKGNRGGEVSTISLYLLASRSVSACVKDFSGITKYYNTSAGAYIDGTEPVGMAALPRNMPKSELDVSSYIDSICSADMIDISSIDDKEHKLIEDAVSLFNTVKNIFESNVDNRDDVMNALRQQHNLLLNTGHSENEQHVYTLVKGSLNYWG
uniref:motility associated factor glycosyltransferase family protein n=1 Tax=Idiomarina abyssalis TaxID=86102 RepID=UPI003A952525